MSNGESGSSRDFIHDGSNDESSSNNNKDNINDDNHTNNEP